MVKKPVVENRADEDGEDEHEVLRHVRIGRDGTKINGHHLEEGHVVELTEGDIAANRDGGVILHDIPEGEDFDEDRFVDVSEPYVAEEGDGA
jgi:hypothetical protein